MAYFKLTGDFRLQGKLQILSLETRNPTACLGSQAVTDGDPALPLHPSPCLVNGLMPDCAGHGGYGSEQERRGSCRRKNPNPQLPDGSFTLKKKSKT